ncbi:MULTISPECIES: DsbA family oxidoreductase [unclassified Streptomyces]|uniref:DsbA family oxidoreductase n=1 Tax=unclassified Streptomyces TaxID=2593676 RepID=UPI00093E7484|nr:DsbA family oxidoreductase [Streptomyces sp. CB02058]OKI96556.1 protein-disulfide isomerase [Streptomyces sp. CB02058]
MRVEIWSDIACPWCYIGKARFEKGLAGFAHRDEVEVVHRSFELDPGRAKGDTEQVIDMLAQKYGRTPEEARGMEANVAANARAEGLGYRAEGRDHGNTFDIHRLLHLAKARGRQDELLTLAYRANFAEERSVFDDAVLADLGVEAGLDADEVRAVLADPEAYADDVRADEREAAELGANAVPFFVLDRRYGISGGQPAEVFAQALERAWQDRPAPTLTQVGGDAAACDADGACEVPQADPAGRPV